MKQCQLNVKTVCKKFRKKRFAVDNLPIMTEKFRLG